jgi:hypothetical protein
MIAETPAERERISEPSGGKEAHLRSSSGEKRVCRHRRPMDETDTVFEKGIPTQFDCRCSTLQSTENTLLRILRRCRRFGQTEQPPRLIRHNEIGERTAYINTYQIFFEQFSSLFLANMSQTERRKSVRPKSAVDY